MPNLHYGFLGEDADALTETEKRDRRRLRDEIDLNPFNLRIWAVAASGFFTDSYNLFATNVILPSLAFVYWHTEYQSTWRELLVNSMTLVGSITGQILFGWLGDRYGRTRLYGVELAIVIFSTIGVASVSVGFPKIEINTSVEESRKMNGNMNIVAWLSIWRFIMGIYIFSSNSSRDFLKRFIIGIGAEYPLSAVITAEWSSTKARGRMLAAVFLMQPVGQFVAHLVGLVVLYGFDKRDNMQENCQMPFRSQEKFNQCRTTVDSIWRIVTGVGAAPALIAILFRLLISDPGLYDLEVKKNLPRALRSTRRVYGVHATQNHQLQQLNHANGLVQSQPSYNPVQFSRADLREFFIKQENWVYLAGTSVTWFLLDFSFYGLGMQNFGTVAKLWAKWDKGVSPPSVQNWNTDPTLKPVQKENVYISNASIYDVLYQNARKSMLTVSVTSIAGSLLFIYAVNYIPRRRWLTTSFLVLSVLFIASGGTFYGVFHSNNYSVAVILVAICHFAFNFGANTLTFMIPAEIFPTTYRCYCHGVSAAFGKLGSVLSLLILHFIHASDPGSTRQGYIFIIFGVFMAIGAIFSWAWIPDIHDGRADPRHLALSDKKLEELGGGYRRAVYRNGECIGFQRKWRKLRGQE